jgi:hypothetical protein
MTVDALIKKLSAYPGDMEVTITDGYDCRCYQGDYTVEEFEGSVDIGIGGTEQTS